MDTGSRSSHQRRERNLTNAVLHAPVQRGPGAHKSRDIIAPAAMNEREVQRRLLKLHQAQVCRRPRYGYWELCPAGSLPADLSGLVHPSATHLLDAARLLDGLHYRTQQDVLLHTYSPVAGERLCIATAGVRNVHLQRDLALMPRAVDRLRQAPLDSDAPGLVMLANLAGYDTQLCEDLRQIRSSQFAVTPSPLPGWVLISVPVRRLPGTPAIRGAEQRVVAAVSILAPEHAQGDALAAYGRMMRNAVHAATETSVVIARPRFAAARAA